MVTKTTRIGSVAAANIGMDDWISAMALLPVPRGTRPVFRSEQSGRGPRAGFTGGPPSSGRSGSAKTPCPSDTMTARGAPQVEAREPIRMPPAGSTPSPAATSAHGPAAHRVGCAARDRRTDDGRRQGHPEPGGARHWIARKHRRYPAARRRGIAASRSGRLLAINATDSSRAVRRYFSVPASSRSVRGDPAARVASFDSRNRGSVPDIARGGFRGHRFPDRCVAFCRSRPCCLSAVLHAAVGRGDRSSAVAGDFPVRHDPPAVHPFDPSMFHRCDPHFHTDRTVQTPRAVEHRTVAPPSARSEDGISPASRIRGDPGTRAHRRMLAARVRATRLERLLRQSACLVGRLRPWLRRGYAVGKAHGHDAGNGAARLNP